MVRAGVCCSDPACIRRGGLKPALWLHAEMQMYHVDHMPGPMHVRRDEEANRIRVRQLKNNTYMSGSVNYTADLEV